MTRGDGPGPIPEMEGPFAEELEAYIGHKRAMGFKYSVSTCGLLKAMGRKFAEMGCDGTRITQDMVDAWCSIEPGQSPKTLGKKASAINGFASYLAAKGWTDVAFAEMPSCTNGSFVPYVFDPDEIARVFRAARAGACAGVREHSYYTAICLCYTCGLRKSEAANLRVGDFDPAGATVTVVLSKNDVTRVVAMSRSTAEVVSAHVSMLPDADPARMLLRGGVAASTWDDGLYAFWHGALDAAGVGRRADGSRPRIHDLRHSFCARALEKMDAEGRDVRVAMPLLSAYLGHKGITETEQYMRLAAAAHRGVAGAAEANLPDFYGKEDDDDDEQA